MAAHTPGPWEIDLARDGSPRSIVVGGDRESVVCNCPECAGNKWGGRTYRELVTCDSHVYGPTLQDARLIATAPDLYEALDRLAGEISGCWGMAELALREVLGNTNYAVVSQRLHDARAVLAKAEGRKS